MPLTDDEFNDMLNIFMKQINKMGKDFGLGEHAFNEKDKELVRDTIHGNTELFNIAMKVHNDFINQAGHTVAYVSRMTNYEGGLERLQQFLIVYYRLRDAFLQDLLSIENEFYKYTVSKIVGVAADKDKEG